MPNFFLKLNQRLLSRDIILLSRNIATLISSGIPLITALEVISKTAHKLSLQKLIQTIKSEVSSGKSFHETLNNYPNYFSEIFINMIKVGETSGTLDMMLVRLANYLEKSETLKNRIKKSLYYPTTILVFSILTSFLLTIFIVPQFEDLFKSSEADLPRFTQIIIHLSHTLRIYGYIILTCLVIGGYFFIKTCQNSKKFKSLIDQYILRIPVFGKLLKISIIARFSRTLATTLNSGTPILVALDSVAGITNNLIYYSAIMQIKNDIAMGQQIYFALNNTLLFPKMMVQMIATGEESGNLVAMLEKIADFYEAEVNHHVDAMTTLAEPLLIIVLGIIVGIFVLAMYLPIFKLGTIV